MSGLLGGGSQASKAPAYTGIDVQTSAEGLAIGVLIGQDRVACNLIWYGDFKSFKGKSPGGKGGALGGGKGGGTREYSASVMLALCEGEVGGISGIWNGQSITSLDELGGTLLAGGAGQTPWSYLTTNHPDDAFAYPDTAIVAIENLQLGSSATLGNFAFETQHSHTGGVPTGGDVNAAEILTLILSHQRLGVGFTTITDFEGAHDYCEALGLWGSIFVREQSPVREMAVKIADSANMAFLWTGTVLDLVPLGDADVSGNGSSWTAPTASVADLTTYDFIAPRGEPAVTIERTRASDVRNTLKLEWKNRANEYNVATVDWKDEASISQIGKRQASVITASHWKQKEPAVLSAQFLGQAMQAKNRYRAKLDSRHCLLLPLDLVTFTEAVTELDGVMGRLESVDIEPDGTVTVVARERVYGQGIATPTALDTGAHYGADHNAPAPDVAEPYIFEPPAVLTNGAREVWVAVTGGENWGGCEVWVSDDDASYRLVDTISGGARYGEMVDALPSAASPDVTNTPEVDLTVSEGSLTSGTTTDADMLNTLSMIDAELIAFETADLTAPFVYELGYIVRGGRGTAIASHAIGAPFVRLDENIASFPFDETRVGATIYMKFVSFNPFGAGKQLLADVTAYSYVLTGGSFGLDEAAAIATGELQAQIDASGRTIGSATSSGGDTTVSGGSFITLKSVAVTGTQAGAIDFDYSDIRITGGGSGSVGSGAGSLTFDWQITEEQTSGGTPSVMVSGTGSLLIGSTTPGDVAVTGFDVLAYPWPNIETGSVTYKLDIRRTGGPASVTKVKGYLTGFWRP